MLHTTNMTHQEALQKIASMAAEGLVDFTFHARIDKMVPKNVTEDDVVRVLTFPGDLWESDDADYVVRGRDYAGNTLHVVVAIEDVLLVVTVY